MDQIEYDKWRIKRYKNHLRLIRRYFQSPNYGCMWEDAANDISLTLAHTPERVQDSVFKNCVTKDL